MCPASYNGIDDFLLGPETSQVTYIIAEIRPEHDQSICRIIKSVGAEYGAVGDGFGPSDPEVLCMSQHYGKDNGSIYYIASMAGQVVGGAGISGFKGSHELCELRKLFLLPGYRGLGIGEALARRCLHYAENWGYKRCYLDTMSNMEAAMSLYRKLGFIRLDKPLEGTAHTGCDIGMIKYL